MIDIQKAIGKKIKEYLDKIRAFCASEEKTDSATAEAQNCIVHELFEILEAFDSVHYASHQANINKVIKDFQSKVLTDCSDLLLNAEVDLKGYRFRQADHNVRIAN